MLSSGNETYLWVIHRTIKLPAEVVAVDPNKPPVDPNPELAVDVPNAGTVLDVESLLLLPKSEPPGAAPNRPLEAVVLGAEVVLVVAAPNNPPEKYEDNRIS